MEMNQVVFVVNDKKEKKILGAFNEYEDALQVALDVPSTYKGDEVSITPVLVDRVNVLSDARKYWLNEQDVVNAVQEEIDLASPIEEDEDEDYWEDSRYDEDYWEDDDWEEDDDDEEEVIDPIEDMVYMMDGKRTISKTDATMILNMIAEQVMEDDDIPANKKWDATQNIMLAFAKEHGLEQVDMSE